MKYPAVRNSVGVAFVAAELPTLEEPDLTLASSSPACGIEMPE
jgi:hypothetical protein